MALDQAERTGHRPQIRLGRCADDGRGKHLAASFGFSLCVHRIAIVALALVSIVAQTEKDECATQCAPCRLDGYGPDFWIPTLSLLVMIQTDYRLISLFSPEQAHALRLIPSDWRGEKLLCWGEKGQSAPVQKASMLLGKEILVEQLEADEFNRLLVSHYPKKEQGKAGINREESSSDVVRFVDKMFKEAVQIGASDIHVERYESEARIRFRWEGMLVEKYQVPQEQYNALLSRLKILAELDIAERRLPQDGRIQVEISGQTIDVRLSTVPGKYGEKAVMRLLIRSHAHLDLQSLGMDGPDREVFQKALHQPNGIILVTGPTGSGKTTSLYASLNLLNKPDKNIMTIEDPIEYNLSGINQVQLKEEIGLSFDRGLRAFLRQDPDIIMVGEIRDQTTAQIAVRAALTGHLVFSTLHTNTAWDAVTRLMDMGIEPYLLAASLRMVVAQRLVKLLCPHCKEESTELVLPEVQKEHCITNHWLPVGCESCYYSGYLGRKAVYEILSIGKETQQSIRNSASQQNFEQGQGQEMRSKLIDWVKAGAIALADSVYIA